MYIDSSVNLIKRFEKHIKGIKSNINLQHAIKKYGLSCFYFIIFETYNIEKQLIFPFLNLNSFITLN